MLIWCFRSHQSWEGVIACKVLSIMILRGIWWDNQLNRVIYIFHFSFLCKTNCFVFLCPLQPITYQHFLLFVLCISPVSVLLLFYCSKTTMELLQIYFKVLLLNANLDSLFAFNSVFFFFFYQQFILCFC